jgi:tRNA G26 N,N-dimethylase Trm1
MTTDELEIWKELNECEGVKQAFECWHEHDNYLDVVGDEEDEYTLCNICDCYTHYDPIWIPPLHDSVRPERSLWEMSRKIREDASWEDAYRFSISDRPDIVLAKAIIEQEGK